MIHKALKETFLWPYGTRASVPTNDFGTEKSVIYTLDCILESWGLANLGSRHCTSLSLGMRYLKYPTLENLSFSFKMTTA